MPTKPLLYVDGEIGKWNRYRWDALASGDDGAPLELNDLAADVSVQAIGADFGGGTLGIEGANDDAPSFAALADPGGTAIGLTAAGITALRDQPLRLRPVLSGGVGGTGSVDVWVLVRLASG